MAKPQVTLVRTLAQVHMDLPPRGEPGAGSQYTPAGTVVVTQYKAWNKWKCYSPEQVSRSATTSCEVPLPIYTLLPRELW